MRRTDALMSVQQQGKKRPFIMKCTQHHKLMMSNQCKEYPTVDFSSKTDVIKTVLFITPSFYSLCPFVCPTFSQQACQRNWTRQLSNPPAVSEDGRWSSLSLSFSFFFFLFALWVQNGNLPSPLLPLPKFCDAISCEQRKEQAFFSIAGWGAVGSRYYPGAGWPWRGHRPLLCSQWHLHSPVSV